MATEEMNKTTDYWKLRMQMTRHLLFIGMKKLAANSDCMVLKALTDRQWMSGLNPFLQRMLPDGNIVNGAPMIADIAMRDDIVTEVADGLKQRIRPGQDTPRSIFKLTIDEYYILLPMVQLYQESLYTETKGDLDVYKCSAMETTIWTLLHVARSDDFDEMVTITKPLSNEDYEACIL